jgi:hypothetical protein
LNKEKNEPLKLQVERYVNREAFTDRSSGINSTIPTVKITISTDEKNTKFFSLSFFISSGRTIIGYSLIKILNANGNTATVYLSINI